jgi:hypothetical protein
MNAALQNLPPIVAFRQLLEAGMLLQQYRFSCEISLMS